MSDSGKDGAAPSIRIDRLLVYLRFARTRSAADALIEGHALRRNRKHVLRGSEQARIGDVLTLAIGSGVRVIELTALPGRRESPVAARSYYREIDAFSEVDGDGLDRKGQMTIAASPLMAGFPLNDPEDSHPKEP
jgi:ribosome-associated heat shock protein Hsp15